MNKNSSTINFKGLNKKIILYFIAFAFVPLFVFSLLGYFLNRQMLTDINMANLHTINRSYAREINAYLSYKRSILLSLTSSKTDSSLLNPHFAAVIRERGAERAILYSQPDYLHAPSIFVNVPGEGGLRAYLLADEVARLLASDVEDYQHALIFLDDKMRIISGGIEAIAADDSYLDLYESDEKRRAGQQEEGVFKAHYRFTDYRMLLTSQIFAARFYEELSAFRNKIIIANIVLVVILLILAAFYSRQITTPVHQLITAVKHIGRGNLDKEIELETNDEIKILAQEFELMRQKLQESYQGMEDKIRVRTTELQEAQVQITHQEKMASLGLMAAGIAHEIGNPLTSISSMAQVIKRKTSDQKTIEYVNNILKGIERISRIVRELVDFSKPSSHKSAVTDVNDVINSAVGIIKYDRRSKNIGYKLGLDANLPKTILVSDHLLQVLLNILLNAVDASEGYGQEIEVKTFSKNGSICIDIKDQGCGISGDKLNKIFEPFYTTKEVGRGTGLGLTVSYGLIKKLNGEIKVKSELYKGSVFSVILPIKIDAEAQV